MRIKIYRSLINGRVKVSAELTTNDDERDFVSFYSYYFNYDLPEDINTYYNLYAGTITCEKVISFLPDPGEISEEEREFLNLVRNTFEDALSLYRELRCIKIFVEEEI